MKRWVLCICIVMLASIGLAEDVSFEATVNKTKLSLNEAVQLTLTVVGTKNSIDPINVPTIEGLDVRYLGPSTAISITNGEYHSERSFIYQITPNKVGHFNIPAMSVNVNGQTLESKPIGIDVTDIDQAAQSAQTAKPDEQVSLKDKVKFQIALPKADAYVHEPLLLSMKLLINGINVRNIQPPQINQKGFEVGYLNYDQGTEVIDGVKYDIINFKVPIYPKQSGALTVGPAQVMANMIYEQGGDDDFFQGLLRGYATRPLTITSGALMINVKDVPQEGKPENFTGAVGQYNFKASVSPTQVKVGDPMTLRMTLSGDGQVKGIDLPTISSPDFKTYEPKVTVNESGKTVEQVIIANNDQVTSIPALSFNYFDPTTKEYRTVTEGPFTIKVLPIAQGEEFKAIGYNDLSKSIDLAKPSIKENPLKRWVIDLIAQIKAMLQKTVTWLILGIVLLFALVIIVWRNFQIRLANDAAFARKTKAYKNAQANITQARSALNNREAKLFYEAIEKTIITYIADHWHVPTNSIHREEVDKFLASKNISTEDRQSIQHLLNQSESIRFAAATMDRTAMQKDIDQLQEVINRLKKRL